MDVLVGCGIAAEKDGISFVWKVRTEAQRALAYQSMMDFGNVNSGIGW